jgi:hypothetical protein
MNYRFNEDQLRVQELIRRVAGEPGGRWRSTPSAEYPQDMFDLLRELGRFTLPVPGSPARPGYRRRCCREACRPFDARLYSALLLDPTR